VLPMFHALSACNDDTQSIARRNYLSRSSASKVSQAMAVLR